MGDVLQGGWQSLVATGWWQKGTQEQPLLECWGIMECLLTLGEERRRFLGDASCKTFQLRHFIPTSLGLPACLHFSSSVVFSTELEGFWHWAASVNPWKHLEELKWWEGWSSCSSCAGLGRCCPRAQARAQLQTAGQSPSCWSVLLWALQQPFSLCQSPSSPMDDLHNNNRCVKNYMWFCEFEQVKSFW